MFRTVRNVIAIASTALVLAACGGGVGVDSQGNLSVYFEFPPPSVVVALPASCVQYLGYDQYVVYGAAAYPGCPNLSNYDLVGQFAWYNPGLWISSWESRSPGTVLVTAPHRR